MSNYSKTHAYHMLPVASAQKFVVDDPVFYDGNGRATVYSTGLLYAGTAMQDVDNTSGANGALNIPVMRPTNNENRYLALTLTSVAVTDIGKKAYFTSSSAVSLTAGSDTLAGIIVEKLATNRVLVDTQGS